jgi:polyhydroxybutyrate depolymerase
VRWWIPLLLLCGCWPAVPTLDPPAAPTQPTDEALLAQRPPRFHAPDAGAGPLPLLVLLHGYAGSGEEIASDFGFDALATPMVWVAPDGTRDVLGARAWDFNHHAPSPPWDIAFLTAVIARAQERYPIDPARIWIFGHSAGAHMALRMGCEDSQQVTAVASSAAVLYAPCAPARPVSLMALHGTADDQIGYSGDVQHDPPVKSVPSAHKTVALFARGVGCGALQRTDRTADLDTVVPGAETTIEASAGCPPGVSVELWTLNGVGHRPFSDRTYPRTVIDFFQAHPR